MKECNPTQLFSLKWTSFADHVKGAFDALRQDGNLVDVTLSCEGRYLKAHRILLSACSSYFNEVFMENPCRHPTVIFQDVKFEDLKAIVDFMYTGEVHIRQEQLNSFLVTAEFLHVQGLGTGSSNNLYETPIQAGSSACMEDLSTDTSDNSSTCGVGNAFDEVEAMEPEEEKQLEEVKTPEVVKTPEAERPTKSADEERRKKVPPVPPLAAISARWTSEVSATAGVMTPRIVNGGSKGSQSERKCGSTVDPIKRSNGRRLSGPQSLEIFAVGPEDKAIADRWCESTMDEYSTPAVSVTPSPAIDRDEVMGACSMLVNTPNSGTSNEITEEPMQGHWLSSLNESDSCENGVTPTPPPPPTPVVERHRYVCSICGSTYKHLRNLRAHCHLHYGNTKCNLCNKVLCNISYFRKHLQQQHGLDVALTKATIKANVPH